MKLIAFILSIFILVMALVPCTDNVVTITNNSDCEVVNIDVQTHDHHQDHSDDCTPFCTCQCCGASVIVTSIFKYSDLKEALYLSLTNNYSFNYTFNYAKGIWHPPAIS